ncbi:MAG: STN domain-containing protein, partial [Opitutaceae bacterium]
LYSNNDLAGVTTREVKGELTHDEALNRLLTGTPLVVTRDRRSGAVAVGRESTDPKGQRAAPKTAGARPTTRNSRSLSLNPQHPLHL